MANGSPRSRGRGRAGDHPVLDELLETPATLQKLKRDDFTLTNATANQRSKIASYEAELPLVLREAPLRLMLIVVEEFTTDGTAGNTETFNLANDIIESPNTQDFVLYENGAIVQPDSVDYANDSFDYTDDGTANALDAFYVARDPVQIEIEKAAPKAQGSVTQTVYDDVSSILHERDQNREPPRMDFEGQGPLAPVVPRKWTLDVYADGSPAFAWDDSDTATDNSATAINAVLSIPIRRAQRDVEGLGQAVKEDAIR